MIANRKFIQQVVMEFNALTPAELAAKLEPIPTCNLVVTRDAARNFAGTVILQKDADMIAAAVTVEIDRRWA